MLVFREINITDREWVNELLQESDYMGCEYSFANNMAWRRLSDSKICRYKNFYIVMSQKDMSFTFPAGEGDLADVLTQMRLYSESFGKKFTIWNASEKQIDYLNDLFPDEFNITEDDTQYDYIYLAQELIEMSGRKFHSKKNHVNSFKKKYNWSFSEITDSDFDDCIEFCSKDYTKNDRAESVSGVVEQFAIHTYFMNFRELGLKGGILRVDGNIAAVSIGEKLNSDTFVVHIEKADTSYNGSYTAMCSEFARHFAAGFKYINREEDLGIEGLRKSKRSYNPVFQLKKIIVTFR